MKVAPTAFALLLAVSAVAPAATVERPPFPAISVIDPKGQMHPLSSVLGKATVLNFWATWCGPCRIELPALQKMYNEMAAKGLVVLAINVDSPRELVDIFMSRVGITLPVFFVDGETEQKLGIGQIPFSILLDREGRVEKVYVGYSSEGMQDLRQRAEGLLGKPRGQGGK